MASAGSRAHIGPGGGAPVGVQRAEPSVEDQGAAKKPKFCHFGNFSVTRGSTNWRHTEKVEEMCTTI